MQLSNLPLKLTLPFADGGAKRAIPAASQIGITAGAASLTDGFPPLTRTPLASGGTPVDPLDMNGILFEMSAAVRWANAGGGYAYDGTFAADAAVGGYPKGARVMRSDGEGYWLNTSENNTTDPEAAGAGWVPDYTSGAATVAMASSNVTLTSLQAGRPLIVITGTLTANLNLVFPTYVKSWLVLNRASGAYSVTCKTASGTGYAVAAGAVANVVGDGTNIINGITAPAVRQIQPLTASVAANALTLTLNPTTLDFRSSTLTSGTVNVRTIAAAISVVISSGSTLGTVNGIAARLVVLAIDNAGTVELAVVNLAGGNNLDETTLINTTAEGGAGAADSANVIYSTTARTGVPFRVVGFVDVTETTAGTWATAPSTIQGGGGQALAAMASLGYGQTWQAVTRTAGTTYYNTTGKPIILSVTYTYNSGTTSIFVNGQDACTSGGNGVGAQSQVTAVIPTGASYSHSHLLSNTTVSSKELR